MKINKNWKSEIVVCNRCKKEFEVKFEVGTNDNCRPVINDYNLERIFHGHVDDHTWTKEEILQWINITQVLFICPHCQHDFVSTSTCCVCNKPVYHWLGHATGYTCSEECSKIYSEWVEIARRRGTGGVIPKEVMMIFLNDDEFIKYSRRRSNG